MFDIIPFKSWHVKVVGDPHEVYLASRDHLLELARAIPYIPACHAVSITYEGRIVGCLGLTVLWEGNADCWTYFSKEACRYPTALVRVTKRVLDRYSISLDLRRTSTNCPVDHEAGPHWMQLLGFEYEGRMKNYGTDGKDRFLYARTQRNGS